MICVVCVVCVWVVLLCCAGCWCACALLRLVLMCDVLYCRMCGVVFGCCYGACGFVFGCCVDASCGLLRLCCMLC